MTDKKLTDNEIIKALECCLSPVAESCNDCPFYEENCLEISTERLALDLIYRQKEEIERLKNANRMFEFLEEAVYHTKGDLRFDFKTIEAKNDAISRFIDKFSNMQIVRIEAIKDFVEKYKTEIKERYENIVYRDLYFKVADYILNEMVNNNE